MFWLVPPDPHATSIAEAYVGFSDPLARLLRSRRDIRVVGISALGRGTPQAAHAGLVSGALAMDDLIAATGVAYRSVANPSFFENLLRQAAAISEQGVFFSAVDPTRKLPACATRDIAEIAARLLLDDGWSGAGHAAALGPEDLSFNDMAATMSDVLDKPIRCQRVDYDAYRAQFVAAGMSDAFAQGMADMARAKSDGLDNTEVRDASNTTPTRFRHWCENALKPALVEPARA